jgi:undecaprenyl-phosphate 4-deoxy-4-formamido-L-arabinose transferase
MVESVQLSVVVPVYRSEALLPKVVARLDKVLDEIGGRAEVILVNDASPDGSWETIRRLCVAHARVRGINLMRNYGQHAALLAGIQASRGNVVVTMDDDMQTPPEEMPKLLATLDKGFDVVYGTREKEQHGSFRNFCSTTAKKCLNKLLGVRVATSITSYKAFRGELRRSFESQSGPVVFIDAILCWGTTRIGTTVVRHEPRENGASGYGLRRLAIHTANMVTSFSQVPLQIASFVGLAAMLLGFVLFLYVLADFAFRGTPVRGFAFLGAALTLFSGVQLFVLGVIGEYLARMHQKLIGMPAYMVRETAE